MDKKQYKRWVKYLTRGGTEVKSLDDLKKIREAAQSKVSMRFNANGTRVLVGMATCGISAGARPVMNRFVEEIAKRNLVDVTVAPQDCTKECELTPIVEIVENGKKTTYAKVTEKDVEKIVSEHIQKGKPVKDFLIDTYRQ